MGDYRPESVLGGSLGLLLARDTDGQIRVDGIDSKSPNSTAVLVGDTLAEVEGKDVRGQPLHAVRPLLQGPVGSSVKVRMIRPGVGNVDLTLMRHETFAVQPMEKEQAPIHRLVAWDFDKHVQMSSLAKPSPLPPEGFLDILVIDVENLPIAYDYGWSMSGSVGSTLSNPLVEAKVGAYSLKTTAVSNKLSAAFNQTLRLPIVDTSDLVIRVKNQDVSPVGGDVIGEIIFPMQQLARPGFSQQGRFRLSVPSDPSDRISPLSRKNAGEIVTGLKDKTSSVSLLLVYNGRSYQELSSAIKLEDEYRKVLAERERLDVERKRLLEEKRLAEEEERRRAEKDAAEARSLAEEAVRKAQREAAVREQILQRQKEQLQRERERWIAEAKLREEEEAAKRTTVNTTVQATAAPAPPPVAAAPPPQPAAPGEDVTPAPKGLSLEHFTPAPEISSEPPKPNYAELSKAVERRLRIEDMLSSQDDPRNRFNVELVPDAEAALRAMAAAGYEIVLVSTAVPWVADITLQHLRECGLVADPYGPIREENVLFCLEGTDKARILSGMGDFVGAIDRTWSVLEAIAQENEDTYLMLFNPDQEDQELFLRALENWKANQYAMHTLVQQLGVVQTKRVGDPHNHEWHDEVTRMVPLVQRLSKAQAGRRTMLPCEYLPVGTTATLPPFNPLARDRPWLQACEALHVPSSMVLPYLAAPLKHLKNVKPITGFYPLAASADRATLSSLREGKVPAGWETVQDKASGQWFYVNHEAKSSSWLLPVHHAGDKRAAAWMQRARRRDMEPVDRSASVGMTLRMSADGEMRVVGMDDGGSAQKSEMVRIDDVLVSIDGETVQGLSADMAMQKLKGRNGTGVLLCLQRGSDVSDRNINKIPWLTMVSEGVADADLPDEIFRVGELRLTTPFEDDMGVFTVTNADTGEVVYRGHGRFEGVWQLLCSEGQPIPGQPDYFLWRNKRLKQPVYDNNGIVTVTDAVTGDVIYKGPGDQYVPGHPGNSPGMQFFVWLKRSVPHRRKRGRVMVDLGRVVLRLVPRAEEAVEPAAAPVKASEAMMVSLMLDHDYDTAMLRKEMLAHQLRRDVALALTVMEDRFTLPTFQRGSVICTFGILPDPNPISAARSPEPGQLAQGLMHQAKTQSSMLRRLPSTRRAYAASVKGRPEQELVAEPVVDPNADQEHELQPPCVCVHIVAAKNVPQVENNRLPDPFVEIELDAERKHTRTVNNTMSPVFRQKFYIPLQPGSEQSHIKVRLCDMCTSLDGEIVGQLAFSIAALRGHLEAGHVNEGWFNLYGRHTTERPVQDNDGNVTALQMRVELIDTNVRRPDAARTPAPLQPSLVGGPAPQPAGAPGAPPATAEGGTMTVNVVGVRNLPTIPKAGQQAMLDPVVLCILGDQAHTTTPKFQTVNATYNERFEFKLSDRDITRRLMVQVANKGEESSPIGQVNFPIKKLLQVGEVQGWYHIKDDQGLEIRGFDAKSGTNQASHAAVKVHVRCTTDGPRSAAPAPAPGASSGAPRDQPQAGIGVVWSVANGNRLYVETFANVSAGAEAGMMQGDELIAVDGRSIIDAYGNVLPFDEVVRLITGPVGSKVQLTLRRQTGTVVLDVTRRSVPKAP